MSPSHCLPPPNIRLVRRLPAQSSVPAQEVHYVRPSLIDWRFTGDAWIVDEGNGTLALRLGDYDLSRIAGWEFDLPSLNQVLNHIWNRRPRSRGPRAGSR
jgi:hypothetical protein